MAPDHIQCNQTFFREVLQVCSLIFRQRQSMMSRHLPLRLEGKLPITGITVGPCRDPMLSSIAVDDLLQAYGKAKAVTGSFL
jgi:hypothetical protein